MPWWCLLVLQMNQPLGWTHLRRLWINPLLNPFLLIQHLLRPIIQLSDHSMLLSLCFSMNLIQQRRRLGKLVQIYLVSYLRRVSVLSTLGSVCSDRSVCTGFLLRRADHGLAVTIIVKCLIIYHERILFIRGHIKLIVHCPNRHEIVVLEGLVGRLLVRTEALGLLDHQF